MIIETEDGTLVNRLTPHQRKDLALLQRAIMCLRYDQRPWQEQVSILKRIRDLADVLALDIEAEFIEPVPELVLDYHTDTSGYPNQTSEAP